MDRQSNEMLDEILQDDSDSLSVWETEFVENLNRYERGKMLTPRQEAMLDKIWRKVFE